MGGSEKRVQNKNLTEYDMFIAKFTLLKESSKSELYH